ncbi:MAG TPA: CHAD domain-containing protein [Candidatus Limnocylindrales bacterium]|nr:CHAD domain-containing protein [Candidatus Limnocylindrales bacterium]
MNQDVEHPIEVELKYRVVDLAGAERYLAAEQIGSFSGSSAARASQFEDRYVDTADGAFARAGFAVRIRQSGRGTVVSVKSLGRTQGAGGSVRREELEGPADRTAGPLEWPASDARSLVLELAGDAPLVELVTIRQLRRKRVVRDGDTRVELSLDEVDVVARSRVVDRFVELEAELVKGSEERLSSLAEVFVADPALAAESGSKLESALAMLGSGGDVARRLASPPTNGRAAMDSGNGDPGVTAHHEVVPSTSDVVEEDVVPAPTPDMHLVVGRTPGVTADDHVAEAARKVMRFHLARMIAREAGVRTGHDLEDVHAMRVATRRQRAAWRVFGAAFRPGRTRRYRAGLRDVATRLGAVRDLDVLLDAADAYRADLPVTEQRAMEPLLADWRTHRDDARVLLVRELDSEGYGRWLDDYRDFVRTEGAAVLPVGATQPHRIRDTTASRVWAAYEQVRGYESVLRWADVETLHELRIAGKWLRYTLEFVREALGDESAALIARVTALQDHLGLLNDANVAASMARTFLVEHAGDLSAPESAAIGRYLVSREREVARLRRSVGPAWRGVAGIGFRRALGRVVAGL